MPDLPKNWEDMIVPEQFKATFDGELFLILEELIPGTFKKVCTSFVFLYVLFCILIILNSIFVILYSYILVYSCTGLGLCISFWIGNSATG